jgi:hypothetical protein
MKIAVWLLTTGLCAAPLKWEHTDRLAAHDLKFLTAAPRCWQKAELRASVTGTYTTPFDPSQIAVDAEIRTPVGRIVRVPAFFTRNMQMARP